MNLNAPSSSVVSWELICHFHNWSILSFFDAVRLAGLTILRRKKAYSNSPSRNCVEKWQFTPVMKMANQLWRNLYQYAPDAPKPCSTFFSWSNSDRLSEKRKRRSKTRVTEDDWSHAKCRNDGREGLWINSFEAINPKVFWTSQSTAFGSGTAEYVNRHLTHGAIFSTKVSVTSHSVTARVFQLSCDRSEQIVN